MPDFYYPGQRSSRCASHRTILGQSSANGHHLSSSLRRPKAPAGPHYCEHRRRRYLRVGGAPPQRHRDDRPRQSQSRLWRHLVDLGHLPALGHRRGGRSRLRRRQRQPDYFQVQDFSHRIREQRLRCRRRGALQRPCGGDYRLDGARRRGDLRSRQLERPRPGYRQRARGGRRGAAGGSSTTVAASNVRSRETSIEFAGVR